MEPKTDVDPGSLLEHKDFVRGVVRGLLADEHAVDDVVQEACLRAIERPPRHAALKAWLARVGRNLALTALRAQRRRGQREHEAARPEGQPSASDAASKLERHRLVVEAVLALEEPFRSAILLRFYEDLPPREIARQLGVPVDTVRSRLRRGIERMRAWFDARHGGNRAAWSLALLPLLGVRAAAAATAAATAAGGGTKVLALGGAAMTMKAKLVGAAIVVFAIAAGVVTWQATAARDRPAAARTEGHRAATEEGEATVVHVDATTVDTPGTLPDRGIGPPGQVQQTTLYRSSSSTGPIEFAGAPDAPKTYRFAEPCGETERGALRVIVTDGAGTALQGTKLVAGLHKDGRVDTTNYEAGADGRLELRSLEPGKWTVSARSPTQHRNAMVDIEGGRFTEVVFVLAGGATIEGTVSHIDRGPLAGVRMSFDRADGGFRDFFSATTDAQGRYRLEGVPPGTYPVKLEGGFIGYESRPRATLVVPGPGPVVQDIVLGRIVLSGTVRDADTGAPIAGVKIQFQDPWSEVSTGGDGRYAVLDLVLGNYKICLMKDGYGTKFSETGPIPPDAPRTVDFALPRAAVLVAEVLDRDGQPIVGQIGLGISMQLRSAPVGREELVVSGTTGTLRGAYTTTTMTSQWMSLVTDSSGIVRYPRIAPGAYDIDIEAKGHLRARQQVEIKPGENRLTFRLDRSPEAADAAPAEKISLQGTIRDAATGRPIAGVRVSVPQAGFRQAFSDAQGVFRLTDVPPGKWTVQLSMDGYGFRSLRDVEFAEAPRALDLELVAAATLHVHITDRLGRAVVGSVYLGVQGSGEGLTKVGTSIEADGEGHGVYRQVVPGRYELRILKDNVGEAKVEVEILPGETVVRVRLE